MKRAATILAGLLVATAAFADVAVIERHGLTGQSGPDKPKRSGRAQQRTPGAQSLTDVSGLDYFINSNITFVTSSSASGAASEASYTGPVNATTSGGGTVSTTLSDAFDGYQALCVSLTGAPGPCVTGNAAYTVYNNNGAGTLDCAGREVVLNAQLIGTISVQRKIFVPSNDSFIRWVDTFTNTGGASQSVTAITSNNLGSDTSTTITGTSSGDLAVSTADTWAASFQNYTGTTSPDVRLGHVFQGPGAPTPVGGITFVNGDDNPFWSYTFSLAAGETKAILNFATGQPSKAAAAAKAAELVSLPVNALQCLNSTQIAQVVNFDTRAVTEVPTVSGVGLAALALLLAGASFLFLRRRSNA